MFIIIEVWIVSFLFLSRCWGIPIWDSPHFASAWTCASSPGLCWCALGRQAMLYEDQMGWPPSTRPCHFWRRSRCLFTMLLWQAPICFSGFRWLSYLKPSSILCHLCLDLGSNRFAWIHWISPCRWQDLEFAGEHYRLFWFLLLPLVGLPIWVNYQSDRDQRVAACTGSPLALPLQSGTPGRDDFLSVGVWWSCMVSDGICNIMTHYDPLVQYEPVTSPQSLFTRKQCMQ